MQKVNIIQLDQDDLFIRDDVFDILFYEAERMNLDLVQIRDIVKQNFYFENLTKVNGKNMHFIFPKNTHFKTQPELKNKMFTKESNYLLWCLLIKTDIYKKAVYHLWTIIINYKIKFQEDYIITFMIVILSQKFKYLNNFALIHLIHSNAASNNFFSDNEYYLGVLFAGNIIYDFYIKNNPKYINIIINYINFFENNLQIGKNKFPSIFKLIMNKIMSNAYLSFNEKNKIIKNFNISDNGSNGYYKEYNFYINNIKFNLSSNYPKINIDHKNIIFNTKITIIIVCSEYEYLEETLLSIQRQNFIYFDIVLVYDNDEKENILLIKKYIKKFNNIKLINNRKIKGFIYSISIGILNSKGLYIMILKPTYILAKKDILNKLYSLIIKNKNIDILEFNILIRKENDKYNSFNIYKCQHFKSQINLNEIKYNKNYTEIDIHKDLLINKLIKSNFIINVVNKYNLIKIKRIIFSYYDNIFLFALQNEKNVFMKINCFGIIKIIKNIKNLKINNIVNDKNQKVKDSIFYLNFLFEYSKNTFENKEIILNEFFNLMSIIYNKFNKITKESLFLYEKFINCKFISQSNKNKLQFYYNSLIN